MTAKKQERVGSTKDCAVGKRYHRLVVLEIVESFAHRRRARVMCDCGATFIVQIVSLASGNTKSCGCLKLELTAARKRTHGHCGNALFAIWWGIRGRCQNERSRLYRNYGGRGIKLCERWQDFELFASDMGPRPSTAHSIDRIDNGGDYAPDNCRWATPKEQSFNRRNNHHVTIDGVTQCVGAWTDHFKVVDYSTATTRLNKLGWEPLRAFTEPSNGGGRPGQPRSNREAP